jgi:predicted acylesterase/phospholipase RssA
LKKYYGEVMIEDLWLPYFSVSSNLSRAEIFIHRSGRVRDSIRASGGLQGLLPPVIHDGDLLVDGALLSNLPVDALKTLMHNGALIAVDVSPPVDLSKYTPYGESLSGWRLLLNKINPLARPLRIPDIATTLQRSGELASIAHQRQIVQQLADLYIRMPVEQFPLFDFKAANRIIDAGYRHAQQVISEWRPRSK